MLRLLSADPWHPNALRDAIRHHLSWATSASIVVGYVSEDGMEMLFSNVADRAKVKHLIFGSVAYSARLSAARSLIEKYRDWFADGTIRMFVPSTAKRFDGPKSRRVHSKIFYFENHADGCAAAIIGSANLTMRALLGNQGETSVEYFGEINDPFFQDLRKNIEATVDAAQPLKCDEQISVLIKTISSANESATKEVTLQDARFPGIETGVHIVLAARSAPDQERPAPGDRIAVHLSQSERDIPQTDHVIHLHFTNPTSSDDESSQLVPHGELGSWRCVVVASARHHEVIIRDVGRTWLFAQDGSLTLMQPNDRSLARIGDRTFFLSEIDKELDHRAFQYAWRRPKHLIATHGGRLQLIDETTMTLQLILPQHTELRIRFTRSSE
jgi:HKD family nuclease